MIRALNEELNYIAQGAMQTRAIPGLPEGFITDRYLALDQKKIERFCDGNIGSRYAESLIVRAVAMRHPLVHIDWAEDDAAIRWYHPNPYEKPRAVWVKETSWDLPNARQLAVRNTNLVNIRTYKT